MIDSSLTDGMVEYALYHVLRIHRAMDRYTDYQRERQWIVLPHKQSSDICVGVMGIGELGSSVAISLQRLGYRV